MKARLLFPVLFSLALLSPASAWVRSSPEAAWPVGAVVTMQLRLGTSPPLIDGRTWDANAIEAMQTWNGCMHDVQLAWQTTGTTTAPEHNQRNDLFFASDLYGEAWDANVLAVTITWTSGSTRTESDILFNKAKPWDAYRGSLRYPNGYGYPTSEFRRVAMHELGHVLGLGHPDQNGQYLTALMNSTVSNLEALAEDDKDGIGSLYGYGPDNQPTLPIITSHPSATDCDESEWAGFSVYATGTAPLHYQWRKDGIALTGAMNSSFAISAVAMADAGDYSVEVTNVAGTTISNSARLTVHALEPPVFRDQPSDVTATEGAYAAISSLVLGRHLSYQWKHDGTVLPNSGNGIAFDPVKKSDAGVYTLTVTNAAGSVTSTPATLTVTPAMPPRITEAPRSIKASIGSYFRLSVLVDGSSPLSYQWFRNGTAINWATESRLDVVVSEANHGASFTVKVTNVAGEVTSAPASLSATMRPLDHTLHVFGGEVRLGESLRLASTFTDDRDATFQWFRNGAAIPGATSSSYAIPSATLADAGEYLLRVTNSTGSVTSSPALVSIMPPSGPYELFLARSWLDIQEYNGIVYVLYATPGRIERYDLAAGQWLPSVLLPKIATAFRVTAGGVYVAFGQSLSRFSAEITREVPVASTTSDTTLLLMANGQIYAFSGLWYAKITVIDPETQSAIRTFYTHGVSWPSLAFAPTSNRIYAASQSGSPTDVGYIDLEAESSFPEFVDTPYQGAFPTPTRVFLAPGEDLLADNCGILYRTSDLTLVAGLGGPLQDVAFLAAGGAVVLRSNRLHRLDTAWRETGVATFAAVGDRLFVSGSDAVVFTQASTAGGAIGVTRVALSSLLPRPPAAPVDATDFAFSPDDVTVDREGTVLLTSRLHRNVFRWSSRERKYLAPATLTGAPSFVAYSSSANELVLAYPDGRIASKASTTGAEIGRGATPLATTGLAAAGDVVFAADANGAWTSHYTIAQDGTLLSQVDWNHYSRVYTWSAVNRRVYLFYDDTSPNNLQSEEIGTDGTIGLRCNSPYFGEVDCIPPIRISPDGQLVLLGSGSIHNGNTLERVGTLANTIDDGDWVGGRLTTIRVGLKASELQQWSYPGFTQTRSVEIEGYPLRLVTLPNGQLLAVTLVMQRPRFSLFDGDLNLIYQSPTSAFASIAAHPICASGLHENGLDLSINATGEGPLTYQWYRNGNPVAGATNSTLILHGLVPLQAGLYDCSVSASGSSALSHPAVVGLTLPPYEPTAGSVTTRPEWQDIHHPNGAIYDQFLLSGAAGTFSADPGQIARCSYLDSNDSIVQVEMSGAGAITVVLDNATGPMAPSLYNQAGIQYMKGKATIILAGADSTTHFTIYSVGTATNPGVTRSDVAYAGWADVAVAGIVSSGGGLGGIHQGNVSYNATLGYTGLYAPTVSSVGGPVVVHNIAASDHALPYLYFAPGGQIEAKIAGGALAQSVGDSITVSGLAHATMGAGQDSCGRPAPAKAIQTRLFEDNGTDVTPTLVTGP